MLPPALISTRYCWMRSVVAGLPAVPAREADTVNWLVVEFHVPPSA